MSTYSKVPPPDHVGSSKPAGISDSYWQRFQRLKSRREELHNKTLKKRAKQLKKASLKAGHAQLSVSDLHYEEVDTKPLTHSKEEAITFDDIQPYLTPNSQLTIDGQEEKSGLKFQLDEAIEQGKYELATTLSDKLTERKLGCQIAAAFDCHRAAKDKQGKVKKPKLKWKYEHKKRWEMKGNM